MDSGVFLPSLSHSDVGPSFPWSSPPLSEEFETIKSNSKRHGLATSVADELIPPAKAPGPFDGLNPAVPRTANICETNDQVPR